MTPAETAQLIEILAGFSPQMVRGDADALVTAWYFTLGDLPYEPCMRALIANYRDTDNGPWIHIGRDIRRVVLDEAGALAPDVDSAYQAATLYAESGGWSYLPTDLHPLVRAAWESATVRDASGPWKRKAFGEVYGKIARAHDKRVNSMDGTGVIAAALERGPVPLLGSPSMKAAIRDGSYSVCLDAHRPGTDEGQDPFWSIDHRAIHALDTAQRQDVGDDDEPRRAIGS